VREALHESAVQQKRRQLRTLEARLSSKRNENVTLALHLAGELHSAHVLYIFICIYQMHLLDVVRGFATQAAPKHMLSMVG
jgi:hypothetical protein